VYPAERGAKAPAVAGAARKSRRGPGASAPRCARVDLKPRPGASDSPGMFFPKRNPAAADPGRFTALRVSLNTPVVTTEELASGPARAAIVQFWAGDRCAIEVRLRASANGRTVVYDFDGPMEAPSDVDHAFEAALNFAEGMGFLFDEDVLSGDDTMSRAKVAEAWTAFEAGKSMPVSPRAAARAAVLGDPNDPLGSDEMPELAGDELVLTDVAPPVSPHDAALAEELASDWTPIAGEDAPAPVAPAARSAPAARPTPVAKPAAAAKAAPAPRAEPPAPPARPGLSKFRGHAEAPAKPGGGKRRAATPDPEESTGRGKTLGRLPLVRKRSPEGGRHKPSLLVRILGAF
jgi:hypothetical protein